MKWAELRQVPKISGLYFDRAHTTQYRFEADVTLIDSQSADHTVLYQHCWQTLRPDLRHVLWQEHLGDINKGYNVESLFPHHGVVLVKPYQWDIFKVDINNFTDSIREQLILKDNTWQIYTDTPKIGPLNIM